MGATRRLRPIGALAVIVMLTVAACGDDGGPSAAGRGTSTTTPAAARTPTSARLSLADLQGFREGHGRSLRVAADGSFELAYRTYTDCDQGDPPPCDRFTDDLILNGGDVQGRFTSGSSPTWTGEITATTDPDLWPKGPITASYDPANDVIGLAPGRGAQTVNDQFTVCGDRSPVSYCGA